MQYKVRTYRLTSGKSPFNVWLDGLDRSASARIDARISRFEMGLLGDAKKLKGVDIYEAQRLWEFYLEEYHGPNK